MKRNASKSETKQVKNVRKSATKEKVSSRAKTSIPLDWLQLTPDGKAFRLARSSKRFTPWGFNYDRDYKMRLLEEFWEKDWNAVVRHFRLMKSLGANAIRLYIQFAPYMKNPTTPNHKALAKLRQVVELANRLGIYLDITGLGCCRKSKIPKWYEALSEGERWDVQARYWEAIARTCADSPAVCWYNLMNEPAVPGKPLEAGKWIFGELGGFCYCQHIVLDPAGRDRKEIARQWAAKLVAAIRRHDQRHLITLGMFPDPEGGCGFAAKVMARELDFLCIHDYPEASKPGKAMRDLEGFAAAGKPVVIEEVFPIHCSVEEYTQFMKASAKYADGWFGFCWGQPLSQLRRSKKLGAVKTLAQLKVFQKGPPRK